MWKRDSCRHCYWKCKLGKLLWKIVRRFLKETEIVLPYDSGSLPLGIYPEKKQEVSFKQIHAPQRSLFATTAKTWKLFYNIIKFPWWPPWAALVLLHAGECAWPSNVSDASQHQLCPGAEPRALVCLRQTHVFWAENQNCLPQCNFQIHGHRGDEHKPLHMLGHFCLGPRVALLGPAIGA